MRSPRPSRAARMRLRVVTGPHGRPVAASWLLLPATDDAPAAPPSSSSRPRRHRTARRRPAPARRAYGRVRRGDRGGARSRCFTAGARHRQQLVDRRRHRHADHALGARFTDAAGTTIPLGARGLDSVASADLSGLHALPAGGVLVLSDVTNPLLGAFGWRRSSDQQKGLGEAALVRADAGLARLAKLLPPPIPRRPVPARPEAWASACSPGAPGSCPAPARSPNWSICAERWLRHPSSSPARARSTDSPPPARRRRTSPRWPPKRGCRLRSSRGASRRCRHLGVRGVGLAHRSRGQRGGCDDGPPHMAARGRRRARPQALIDQPPRKEPHDHRAHSARSPQRDRGHRPPHLRRLRRASRPPHLRRHLRARASRRPTPTDSAPM